jgi:RecB family exonuclease
MRTIRLSFSEDPARYTACYLSDQGYSPDRTLIVSPTERFKSYFAHHLLSIRGAKSILGPALITSAQLMSTLAASTGRQRAGEAEKLSMFFEACRETEGIEDLFGEDFLQRFGAFRRTASDIFRDFDELNAEKLDIENLPEHEEVSAYREFARHFRIFQNLFRCFREKQASHGVFVQSFLLDGICEHDIERFFSPYEHIIVVSPLSLTAFEKWLYEVMERKLDVLYQDTDEYDFSKILGFAEGQGFGGRVNRPALCFFNLPTRTEQLMALLGEVENDLDSGVDPCEISVINADSLFCEMLYDSFVRAGIPVNYSEGLQVKKSPLYGFLVLVGSFYTGNRDTELFVEITKNAIFREALCDLSPRDVKKLEKRIIEGRIFTLEGKNDHLIKSSPVLSTGFSQLDRIYGAGGFDELSRALSDFFALFKGKKTYDFYAVRDMALNEAMKLCSFTPKVLERPLQILLEVLAHKRYAVPGIYREGIQIIGLLETRGITFKRVYVPSFNEGFFPFRGEKDVLLNANFRSLFGLHTLLDREDLQFYYLKRIVDAADRTGFLSIDDRTGEIDVKSRYTYYFEDLYRVEKKDPEYILPIGTGNCRQSESGGYQGNENGGENGFAGEAALPVQPAFLRSPVLQLSRLDLDTMKRCETKYYISRVLGIEKEEVLSREIELNEVGRKVHELFFELYRTPGDNKRYRERFEELFRHCFERSMFYSREEALLKRVLHANLRQVLENDLERFTKGYRVCADYAETELSAQIGGKESTYTLRGRIDRVDLLPSGGYEIIDYKTGTLPGRGDHFEKKGFKEVQLGFYGLMFKKTYPEADLLRLSYYDLTGGNRTEVVVDPSQIGPYLEAFEMHIIDFLDNLNSGRTLGLAHEHEECAYCPYFNICRVFEQ